MQVLLVRHGESEPNAATPDWDLSARGEWEAQRVGQRLSGVGVTHVVSSPLLRALATAHIIAECYGWVSAARKTSTPGTGSLSLWRIRQ